MKPSSHQTRLQQKSKETLMDPWPDSHGSWANAWCMDRDTQPSQKAGKDRGKREDQRSSDAYGEE